MFTIPLTNTHAHIVDSCNPDVLGLHVGFLSAISCRLFLCAGDFFPHINCFPIFTGIGSCRDTTVRDMCSCGDLTHSMQETHRSNHTFVQVFEGIFTSQFDGDTTMIAANPGSSFFMSLDCTNGEECYGTVGQWIAASFPDFSSDNIKWDILYLVLVIFVSRVITFMALTTLDYTAT